MDSTILSFLTLSNSIVFSLYRCFSTDEVEIDYKPTTLDKQLSKKILWYLSHFTYSNTLLLTIYFGLRLFDYKYDQLFLSISPIALSVNINYFLILYPKERQTKNIKLYQLSYHNIVQHYFTTFIILNELKYVEYDHYYYILNYNYVILYGIAITYFNYYYRNIWTYGIADLYTYKGWKLFFQFKFVSLFSSLSLYYLKKYLY